MTTDGQRLYERYRRHEADAVPWIYLDQEERTFWDTLAKALR